MISLIAPRQNFIYDIYLYLLNSNIILVIIACFSLNKISSLSLRGRMPGSVHAVRNKTDNTKTNNKAPTIGIAIDKFSYKYGQLEEFKEYREI